MRWRDRHAVSYVYTEHHDGPCTTALRSVASDGRPKCGNCGRVEHDCTRHRALEEICEEHRCSSTLQAVLV